MKRDKDYEATNELWFEDMRLCYYEFRSGEMFYKQQIMIYQRALNLKRKQIAVNRRHAKKVLDKYNAYRKSVGLKPHKIEIP